MEDVPDRAAVVGLLARAGCVAADEEADELLDVAGSAVELQAMVDRRLTGEPLAWITGRIQFCGLEVLVDPGVYVPRWQSEPLARLAADLLPPDGVGVDLATGSGALAMVMAALRPDARVLATELDPAAVRCARRNGVTVLPGHLDRPLPVELAGMVDVLCGVLPYVPTEALHLLPRDVLAFEPRVALDGGHEGLEVMAPLVRVSRRWLKPGGWLVLEVGADQVPAVRSLFETAGYGSVAVVADDDGDPRGLVGRRTGPAVRPSSQRRP